jgi:hypothetical protein
MFTTNIEIEEINTKESSHSFLRSKTFYCSTFCKFFTRALKKMFNHVFNAEIKNLLLKNNDLQKFGSIKVKPLYKLYE